MSNIIRPCIWINEKICIVHVYEIYQNQWAIQNEIKNICCILIATFSS